MVLTLVDERVPVRLPAFRDRWDILECPVTGEPLDPGGRLDQPERTPALPESKTEFRGCSHRPSR